MFHYKMTYKTLCEKFHSITESLYVETNEGDLSKINAVMSKESDMLYVGFSNGYVLECSTEHAFMDKRGEPIFGKNLRHGSKILTTHGILEVTSIKRSKNKESFDISIDYPHWYVNDEHGIIHHNTSVGLLFVASYLKQFEDAVCLFYDSEFGAKEAYFTSFGIDTDRVVHTPVTNVEELKMDMAQQLDSLEKGDRVIFFVDSIGNLASKKEVEDALDSKSVADMTRAKAIKSLFRIVTPYFTLKDIPGVFVAHTYGTQETYSRQVVSGGSGITYSSDNILIIGRQQEKDGAELLGYNFVLNVEKSRFVKEKTKLSLLVTFDGGIDKMSGLFDSAVDVGFITSEKKGFFSVPSLGIENSRRSKIERSGSFWKAAFENGLKERIEEWYKLGSHSMLADDTLSAEDVQPEADEVSVDEDEE